MRGGGELRSIENVQPWWDWYSTCRSKIRPNFDFHMCVTPNCKATMNSSPESQYTLLIINTFMFASILILKKQGVFSQVKILYIL